MIRTLAALILLSAPAFAVEPVASIKAPAIAKVARLVELDATASTGDEFLWESTTGEEFAVDSGGKRAWFVAQSPGRYRFLLVAGGTVEGKTRLNKAVVEVVVDGIAPAPTPVPTPTPSPAPSPAPTPAPTADKLRVLFLFESSGSGLSRGQAVVLSSPKVEEYLSAKCVKENDLPAWRRWDKDIDASRESDEWQTALRLAKADPTPVPKIAIFNGVTLLKAAPIPANETAAIEMLQAIGGVK